MIIFSSFLFTLLCALSLFTITIALWYNLAEKVGQLQRQVNEQQQFINAAATTAKGADALANRAMELIASARTGVLNTTTVRPPLVIPDDEE